MKILLSKKVHVFCGMILKPLILCIKKSLLGAKNVIAYKCLTSVCCFIWNRILLLQTKKCTNVVKGDILVELDLF